MASLSFEVVHAFTVDGYRGLVIARPLDAATFALGLHPTLAGCPLQSRIEVPWGAPPGSCVFYLESLEDLPKFIPGQRVLLNDVAVGTDIPNAAG
jgi:hypothetical protein